MTGDFTAYCNDFYRLTELLASREAHFQTLVDNAPYYNGQFYLSDIDAIITYYRNAQAAKAKIDSTFADLKEAERNILLIMRHFDIPPGTVLIGEIPGELTYEIWVNEHDAIFINKIKEHIPDPDGPEIMVFKFTLGGDGE